MIIVPEIWITKDYFCPFNPSPQQQGKSKFWKNEKNAWRYYHFTRVYHKWKSNDVWLLRYEMWQNFLLFWATFCPFTPLTTQKIKILRKWKKQLEILSFYTHVSKIMITCYTIPEIWHMTDIIYISYFGPFSAILPPKSPKKQNFKKWKKKNTWRYYHFTNVYQKLWSHDVRFLRYGVGWMNGPTDGQKNWHVEMGRRTEKLTCRDRCTT